VLATSDGKDGDDDSIDQRPEEAGNSVEIVAEQLHGQARTRQNLEKRRGWKDSLKRPPSPWSLYAFVRIGFSVEESAAFPRHAPMTVTKMVGMEIPKRVKKNIFQDLVLAG
jgi:hypothetical protein